MSLQAFANISRDMVSASAKSALVSVPASGIAVITAASPLVAWLAFFTALISMCIPVVSMICRIVMKRFDDKK